jgi:hypothetical protein
MKFAGAKTGTIQSLKFSRVTAKLFILLPLQYFQIFLSLALCQHCQRKVLVSLRDAPKFCEAGLL